MAHLDKNGIAIAVGQSVRLKFPGTDDLCVGRVVGIDFGGVDIEAEHFGAKQSVVVKADTLEFVANDLIASLEVRLEAARNAVVNADAQIANARDARVAADRAVELAIAAMGEASALRSKASSLVSVLTTQLSEAKAKLADEEAAKEAHGNDPNTVAATGLQVMTPPIIPSPALPVSAPVRPVDPTIPDANPDTPIIPF